MEIINITLDKYCKMIYFWRGENLTLGKLSNKELASIIKFIDKYPEGLLNGYEKSMYLLAVKYILNWRENDTEQIYAILEDRLLQKAERKATLLTNICYNSFRETSKRTSKIFA